MSERVSDWLLAGDVGGTKTVLALVATGARELHIVAEGTFDSRRFLGLEEMVAAFLERHRARAGRASFSVAGPVMDGRVKLSNLPWAIDAEAVREAFGLESVQLCNDLQATAYAVPVLAPDQLLTLQPGVEAGGEARAVIAPGTGLGEAFLLRNGGDFHAFPSEGGNADFAPADPLQRELLRFLQERDGHVSYEDVCSGRGIPNIYSFLRADGVAPEPDWLRDRLADVDDPAPIIVQVGLEELGSGSICDRTLTTFAAILAAEAGNLALRVLATGGVYLGGGIPPRILPVLQREAFVAAFRSKGSFSELLARVPLRVILEPRAALLGAARYGLEAERAAPRLLARA